MRDEEHGLRDDGPPTAVASAYPNGYERKIVLGVLAFFTLLMFRNVLFKDYQAETKAYLTSIGKADRIDLVVPKTMADVKAERLQKEKQFIDLVANVTTLQNEVKLLKAEVARGKPISP